MWELSFGGARCKNHKLFSLPSLILYLFLYFSLVFFLKILATCMAWLAAKKAFAM
jgi:hypothetical protein